MTTFAPADSSLMSMHLPDLVRSYVARSLPPDGPSPAIVRVTQTGEMLKKPGARPLRFQATEDFAVDHVAFSWRARFPIVGPLALTVVDGFADGDGQLCISLLGIPLRTQKGPETSVGEAMRYLAELAWVPQAVAANRELEWREVDARTVEVACEVAAARVAVRWVFNEPAILSARRACGRSRSERPSCRRPGAATSATTRASPAPACLPLGRRGGNYQKVASSTGAVGSRGSS